MLAGGAMQVNGEIASKHAELVGITFCNFQKLVLLWTNLSKFSALSGIKDWS